MRKILLVSLLLLGLLTTGAAVAGTDSTVLLNAAGATFPNPIYSKWFDVYHTQHPSVQINYQSIGSGGGIRQLLAGTVDFGASDRPMTDDQLSQAKFKILHFPTVLGAVVPTYNVPGVTGELISSAVPGGQARFVPDAGQVPELVAGLAKPGDLVLTMGAGDVTLLGPQLVEALGRRRG